MQQERAFEVYMSFLDYPGRPNVTWCSISNLSTEVLAEFDKFIGRIVPRWLPLSEGRSSTIPDEEPGYGTEPRKQLPPAFHGVLCAR